MRMLITRPRHDKGTEYLYAWSEKVIKSTEEHGWKADRADDSKVTAKEIHSRLEKKPAEFVFFNGHGNESQIFGLKDEPILSEQESHLLRGTITFARACNCAAKLGKSAVKNGCNAFIGYSSEFWFPMVSKYQSTPLRDPAAKSVLEVSNAVPMSITKKSTAVGAVDSAKRLAIKHMLKLILSKEPYDRAALKAIIQNDEALTREGKADARVES